MTSAQYSGSLEVLYQATEGQTLTNRFKAKYPEKSLQSDTVWYQKPTYYSTKPYGVTIHSNWHTIGFGEGNNEVAVKGDLVVPA